MLRGHESSKASHSMEQYSAPVTVLTVIETSCKKHSQHTTDHMKSYNNPGIIKETRTAATYKINPTVNNRL